MIYCSKKRNWGRHYLPCVMCMWPVLKTVLEQTTKFGNEPFIMKKKLQPLLSTGFNDISFVVQSLGEVITVPGAQQIVWQTSGGSIQATFLQKKISMMYIVLKISQQFLLIFFIFFVLTSFDTKQIEWKTLLSWKYISNVNPGKGAPSHHYVQATLNWTKSL